MSKTIPALLAQSYQKALVVYCDNDRNPFALIRLMRVRELQTRAAAHYKVPLLKGARA